MQNILWAGQSLPKVPPFVKPVHDLGFVHACAILGMGGVLSIQGGKRFKSGTVPSRQFPGQFSPTSPVHSRRESTMPQGAGRIACGRIDPEGQRQQTLMSFFFAAKLLPVVVPVLGVLLVVGELSDLLRAPQ
eukprot:3744996-Rhodomonas_salina.1